MLLRNSNLRGDWLGKGVGQEEREKTKGNSKTTLGKRLPCILTSLVSWRFQYMLLSSLHTVSTVVFLVGEGKLLKWNLKGFLRQSLLLELTHDTWWSINFILTSWGHSLQEQRSAHPFCKGLCNKYFRLCKPCYSVTAVQLCCCSSKADRDKMSTVCSRKTLFTKAGGRLDLAHGLQSTNLYSRK